MPKIKAWGGISKKENKNHAIKAKNCKFCEINLNKLNAKLF